MKDTCDICKREKYEHTIIQEKILTFIFEEHPELKQTGRVYIRVCHDCWKSIKTKLGQKI